MKRAATAKLPTEHGGFELVAYENHWPSKRTGGGVRRPGRRQGRAGAGALEVLTFDCLVLALDCCRSSRGAGRSLRRAGGILLYSPGRRGIALSQVRAYALQMHGWTP